jgi:hypothetical protein
LKIILRAVRNIKIQIYNFFSDLIAVSSTVIPLAEYELTAKLGDPISEEYKKAYMKHLKKKKASFIDPDKLITGNSNKTTFLNHEF